MVSEFLIIGALGSLLLGPKKMAKLMADVARVRQQFTAKKAEIMRHLDDELNASAITGSVRKAPEPDHVLTNTRD